MHCFKWWRHCFARELCWSKRESKISFSEWLYQKFINKETIFGFSDVYFSPLFVDDLCIALLTCLSFKKPGLFNLGATTGMSKFEFIRKTAQEFDKELKTKIIAKTYDEMKFLTPRPKDMRMDSHKFMKSFNFILPPIEQTISKLANQFRNRKSGL